MEMEEIRKTESAEIGTELHCSFCNTVLTQFFYLCILYTV